MWVEKNLQSSSAPSISTVAPSFWRWRPSLEGSLLWESVRWQMTFGFVLMCLRVSWYRASSVSNTQTAAAPMHESQKLSVFASGGFLAWRMGECSMSGHGDADLCFSETVAGCVLPNWSFFLILQFMELRHVQAFTVFLLSMIPCNYN